MTRRLTTAAALVVATIGATVLMGCARTQVKRAEEPAKTKAWIATLVFDASALDAPSRVLFTSSVKKAAPNITEALQQRLGQWGFETYFDKKRAGGLGVKDVLGEEASTLLTGGWAHPETTQIPIDPVSLATSWTDLFSGFEDTFEDAIVSITVVWSSGQTWIPTIDRLLADVRITAYTKDGDLLLSASALGEGEQGFLVPGLTASSLEAAVQDALKKLDQAEIVEVSGRFDPASRDQGPRLARALSGAP